MKKILSVILILALAFVLASCESPKEKKANKQKAEEVDELILAIGDVTKNSEYAIAQALGAYNELNDAQKEMVQNHDLLLSAISKMDEIIAGEVDKIISEIGTVKLEKESAISNARIAYDRLTSTQKNLVKSYNVLVSSEKTLNDLKEEKRRQEMVLNVGDTVSTNVWSIKLAKAYTSNRLQSKESRIYYDANDGYSFLILEFDVTCLNSNHPTIDDDGITNLVAKVNGNSYGDWTYQYTSGDLWLYIRHTYLDANLPLHVYVYTYIPRANLNDRVTVELKLGVQDKLITIN